jgi:hypothetical protein
MLSYLPRQCDEKCGIDQLLGELDTKLSKQIKLKWQQIRYLTDNTFCKETYFKLLIYKKIGEKLSINPDYLKGNFTTSQYISRVKILIK